MIYGHRGSELPISFAPFQHLTSEQQFRTRQMGAMVQLADALDRAKSAEVHEVQANLTDRRLELVLHGTTHLPEGPAVQRRIRQAETVLGKEIQISIAAAD